MIGYQGNQTKPFINYYLLAMYIEISNPYLISVAVGVDHFIVIPFFKFLKMVGYSVTRKPTETLSSV
jgi:hypothetical protein